MSNRSVESITVRCSSEKTRKVDDCHANGYAAGLAVAAAAPLPAHPDKPVRGSLAVPPTGSGWRSRRRKSGPGKDIPHVTPAMIVKYITGLKLLGLL
jgi:hypothetical protein